METLKKVKGNYRRYPEELFFKDVTKKITTNILKS